MALGSRLALITTLVAISFTMSSAQLGLLRPPNVTLAGVVTCANTSVATARTFPVVPQARVDVVCGLSFLQRAIKSATTNLFGIYSISFSQAEVLFQNPELCYLNVTLPANSCTFDPPGGHLRFPIVGTRSGLRVVQYIPGAMSYVPAQ